MSVTISVTIVTFLFLLLGIPILLVLARIFGLYAIVQERTCAFSTTSVESENANRHRNAVG